MGYIIKKIIIFILIITIIVAVYLSTQTKNVQAPIIIDTPIVNTEILEPIGSTEQLNDEYLEEEKLFAEKYIRENIKNIALNQAVLGGTWYVVSINITPSMDTGEIVYEDGHIQNKASFTYTYEKNPQSITVTKFEVKE